MVVVVVVVVEVVVVVLVEVVVDVVVVVVVEVVVDVVVIVVVVEVVVVVVVEVVVVVDSRSALHSPSTLIISLSPSVLSTSGDSIASIMDAIEYPPSISNENLVKARFYKKIKNM